MVGGSLVGGGCRKRARFRGEVDCEILWQRHQRSLAGEKAGHGGQERGEQGGLVGGGIVCDASMSMTMCIDRAGR